MIPILYRGNETSFTSNGLGRLSEIISCTVTEERNGIYELEFEYPIDGKLYQTMLSMVEYYSTGNYAFTGIVACIHDDTHDIQPFDLYSVSAPFNGIATFNAHHISYRLNGVAVAPFTASNASDAMTQIPLKISGPNQFTFWTNKGTSGSFELKQPGIVRSILGGQQGSILDCFGTGEYKFDKFSVQLYQNRGVNTGVTIRYGKNMTDASREVDGSDHYNAIAPFWSGSDTDPVTGESSDVVVYLSPLYVQHSQAVGSPVVRVVDFSSRFQEMPTQEQLRQEALRELSANTPWITEENIKISFVQLWQTTEYENVALLQRVSLCDTVSVYYQDLGIILNDQKVIKVVYNVLMERYDEMELGKPKYRLSDEMIAQAMDVYTLELEEAKKNAITNSMMQAAIAHATNLLSGGLGGYVVFNKNADGEPQEILIMDTDDISTAVNVIRINRNGIGFSHNGYNGPFESAWTIDGSFNANFIVAGSISASMLSGGTLRLGGANNGNGVMRVYNANSYNIGTLDNSGFEIISNNLYNTNEAIVSNLVNATGHRYKVLVADGDIVFYYLAETYGSNGGMTSRTNSERMRLRTKLITTNDYQAAIELKNTTRFSISGVPTISFLVPGGSNSNAFHFTSGQLWMHCINGTNTSNHYFRGDYCTIGTQLNVLGSLDVDGMFTASGTKNRSVATKDYGQRILSCYETPSPMFGDIGEGVIGEDGFIYIFMDPIFSETIDSSVSYQVFLQAYGNGTAYVSERKSGYFIVSGTPGLRFGWELKAKQFDHNSTRIPDQNLEFYKAKGSEVEFLNMQETNTVDYGEEAANYIKSLEEGRVPA